MQMQCNGLIPTWKKKDDHDGSERVRNDPEE